METVPSEPLSIEVMSDRRMHQKVLLHAFAVDHIFLFILVQFCAPPQYAPSSSASQFLNRGCGSPFHLDLRTGRQLLRVLDLWYQGRRSK